MFRIQELKRTLTSGLVLFMMALSFSRNGFSGEDPPLALVIHGGAGTILRKNMTAEREQAFRDKLDEVLTLGHGMLQEGRSSLDVVEACIVIMEDSPLFNAGKGAVFTHQGTNELDASIMRGDNLAAGAVAGVTRIKNPISLARKVMEASPHVLMAGQGAEAFAQEQGVALVDPSYFFTQPRWDQLKKAKEKEDKHGTVGVVALDREGNLAAGTSTGGMTNKKYGRVGDSPIIGAGTYADNRSCGVSATGHGEFFIRAAVAHDIAALVAYRGLSVQAAADEVIQNKLTAMGGSGGVIVLDTKGNMAFSFNTAGMYRGSVNAKGERMIGIYSN